MNARLSQRASRLVLAAAVCTGAMVTAPSVAHAAAGDPFVPSAGTTVLQSQDNPTGLFEVIQNADGTVSTSPVGAVSGFAYNALAYNPADGYLYAMRNEPNQKRHLLRIGQENTVTDLGEVAFGFALGTDEWVAGAFDSAGNYYISRNNTVGAINNVYVVDVTALSVQTLPLTAGVTIVPDWVFKDGFLWGIGDQTNTLYRVNATSGQVESWSGAAQGLPAGRYGAAWAYDNGNIAFQANGSGVVYQLSIPNPSADPATPSPTMFQVASAVQGQAGGDNDGTSIPGSPIDLSVTKTAPATYGAGDTLAYEIVVTNESAGSASGWTLNDQLPAGTSVASIDSGTATCNNTSGLIQCNGGELAGGDSVTITITIDTPAVPVSLSNTAELIGNDADPTEANNTSTAVSDPETPPIPLVDPAMGLLIAGGAATAGAARRSIRRRRVAA